MLLMLAGLKQQESLSLAQQGLVHFEDPEAPAADGTFARLRSSLRSEELQWPMLAYLAQAASKEVPPPTSPVESPHEHPRQHGGGRHWATGASPLPSPTPKLAAENDSAHSHAFTTGARGEGS